MTCESQSKAKPMSLREMVYMVKVLDVNDYDCQHGKYPNADHRKDRILQLAVAMLQRKCGVTRTKVQLKKSWSDLKNKKLLQLESIRRLIARKSIRRKMQSKQELDASVEANKSQQNEEQEGTNQLSQEVTQSLSAINLALERITICMDEKLPSAP